MRDSNVNRTPAVFVEGPEQHWQKTQIGNLTLHLRPCGSALKAHDVAVSFADSFRDAAPDWTTAKRVLASIEGRFVLVLIGPDWVLGAVDRIRSAPLLYAKAADGTARIGMHAPSVAAAAGLDRIHPDGALALAMGGFTVGDATLYSGLRNLRPGEAVLQSFGCGAETGFYAQWRPWQENDADPATLHRRLSDTTFEVIERTRSIAGGREIVVPLSAGYDSRVIVAALKVLGSANVRCFAYGPPGCSEVETSRAVAARLGYPWRHVAVSPGAVRRGFLGPLFPNFMDFADSGCATPFVQDLFVLEALMKDGWLPRDAVIVNGQSGDFVSGNHVPDAINALALDGSMHADADARAPLFAALQRKHFSLWESLRNPADVARVDALLEAQIAATSAPPPTAANAPALFEHLEFMDRQSKYTIAGQRSYEFFGLDWSLPLWDDPYLAFWEAVPRVSRRGQALYRKVLRESDWGGVWRSIPLNQKRVRPVWAAAARGLAKPLFAFLPRSMWRRFEKNALEYWTDVVGNYGIQSYSRVLFDRRGHRNAISWITEAYLARHALAWDRSPLERVAA
jgi:asparagine synthase (glutamine-hydrolysing)